MLARPLARKPDIKAGNREQQKQKIRRVVQQFPDRATAARKHEPAMRVLDNAKKAAPAFRAFARDVARVWIDENLPIAPERNGRGGVFVILERNARRLDVRFRALNFGDYFVYRKSPGVFGRRFD